jgi:hypothetical protein
MSKDFFSCLKGKWNYENPCLLVNRFLNKPSGIKSRIYITLYNLYMKSFLTIVFSVFYLALSTGMSFNVHLCTWKVASSEDSDCSKNGCCTNGEKQSCCTDITYVLQFEDVKGVSLDNLNSHDDTSNNSSDIIFVCKPVVELKLIPEQVELSGRYSSIPLYSLHCSHLHYG